jgi:hypothetical protein
MFLTAASFGPVGQWETNRNAQILLDYLSDLVLLYGDVFGFGIQLDNIRDDIINPNSLRVTIYGSIDEGFFEPPFAPPATVFSDDSNFTEYYATHKATFINAVRMADHYHHDGLDIDVQDVKTNLRTVVETMTAHPDRIQVFTELRCVFQVTVRRY